MAGIVGSKKKKGQQQSKKGSKHKFTGRNNGPARQKYWASGRLEARKIAALMQHNDLTRAEAYVLWHAARQGRKK
jgi:hypothetical protein